MTEGLESKLFQIIEDVNTKLDKKHFSDLVYILNDIYNVKKYVRSYITKGAKETAKQVVEEMHDVGEDYDTLLLTAERFLYRRIQQVKEGKHYKLTEELIELENRM